MIDTGQYDACKTTASSLENKDAIFARHRKRLQTMHDKMTLSQWLRERRSYNDIAELSRFGLVENERFSERARRLYLKLWEWSAHRMSSRVQNDLYCTDNMKLNRRIERCQHIINRLMEQA